jgi:adenosine deaminase
MMFELAARNDVALPYGSAAEVREAYAFSNLQDFLDLYYQGMGVLRTEADFYELTRAYLHRSAEQNVRHAEIFFDPQGHTTRGVAFETLFEGIWRACRDAERDLGITSKLIMCFLRHLDEADAERTLDEALAYKDRIVGVGLDSSELGHPPSKFARVFARARDEGLLLCAHAGEEGPPEYIWEAIDVLGVDRIDHGNRALEDDALVKRLAADRTPLTVCPLSNLRLCGVTDMREHPLKRMLDAGLFVTVNSDDPSYFGGYVNENFKAVEAALKLGESEIVAICRNSFEASFLSAKDKSAVLAAFDASLATSS